MKKILFLIIAAIVATNYNVVAQGDIFAKGDKAPNVHHTGDVWLNHLSDADETFPFNIVQATSAPGAKLNWHIHPGGQQLLITKGTGYYQERGKKVQIVEKGDVIKCLPGVEHWHAATPNSEFVYIAISGKERTKWLEALTEETYNSIASPPNFPDHLEAEIIALSKQKWEWMASKDADKLSDLFHEKSQFVHMGGTWGKEREVNIIRNGGIHYKKADIHEVEVDIIDDTAILFNRITLLAVVGGNEVTNPFMVTEVYIKQESNWKLANLSFVKQLSPGGN